MLTSSLGDSNCFTVFGLLRSVTLEVESTLDRDRWVAALRACVAFNVEVQKVKCVSKHNIYQHINTGVCFMILSLACLDHVNISHTWIDLFVSILVCLPMCMCCCVSLSRRYGHGGKLDDEGRVEMAEDDIQRLARERAAALLADEEERKYEEQYGGDSSKKDKKKDKSEANLFESPLAKVNGTTGTTSVWFLSRVLRRTCVFIITRSHSNPHNTTRRVFSCCRQYSARTF